jgi:phage terminase small subunit
MPRKAAEALSVVRLDPRPKAPVPRREASAEVKALFNHVISNAAKGHFTETDDILLELYCLAVLEARNAYANLDAGGRVLNGRPSPWIAVLEKAQKAIVSYSVRLRLGPQSRVDPRSSKLKGPPASAYDLLRRDHVDEA